MEEEKRVAGRQTIRLWSVLVVMLVTVGGGCLHGEKEEDSARSPGATAEPAREGSTGAPVSASELAPYFEEGAFAEARQHFEAEDWKEAAEAFERALAAAAKDLSDEMAQRAQFLWALSLKRSGDAQRAAVFFAELGDRGDVLSPYAWALASEAALESKQLEAAATLAEQVPEGAVLEGRSELVLAQVRAGQSRASEARAHYERAAASSRGRTRRVAELGALEMRVADEAEDRAALAEDLVAFVQRYEGRSDARTAREWLDAVSEGLSAERRKQLLAKLERDPMDEARELVARHRSEKAIEALTRLRKKKGTPSTAEEKTLWCEQTYLLAKSHTKLRQHGTSSGFYDAVIEQCAGQPWHHKALYNAGKAYWNSDKLSEARARFAQLRKDYADHSYADDAYWLEARVRLDEGKPEKARVLLTEQLERYPEGDMAKEAHWLLVAQDYRSGEYGRVVAYVDANAGKMGEDDIYSLGRMAYFRARSLETLGQHDEAHAGFEAVLREHPLSYYGLLAMGRLAVVDEARLSGILAEVRVGPYVEGEEWPSFAIPGADETPELARGIALMRLGLSDWAEAELELLKSRAPEQVPGPEILAALYHGAGLYPRSHRLAELAVARPARFFSKAERGGWSLAYPRPWLEKVKQEAERQAIDVELAYAIMREESGYNPRVESFTNARGLMQLMMPTAESMARELDMASPTAAALFTPDVAIPLGVGYLGKLSRLYGAHPLLTIAGYNAGQGNLGRWLSERGEQPLDLWVEEMPFGQTREYTKRVSMTYLRYRWLYADAEAWPRLDPAQPVSAGL